MGPCFVWALLVGCQKREWGPGGVVGAGKFVREGWHLPANEDGCGERAARRGAACTARAEVKGKVII